jgi:hypothetical protein
MMLEIQFLVWNRHKNVYTFLSLDNFRVHTIDCVLHRTLSSISGVFVFKLMIYCVQ